MPIQAPQWTEFLSCPICCHMFDEKVHRPISLACGHTVCKSCLVQLPAQKKCPFDQTLITRSVDDLPVNFALLQLVGVAVPPEDQYNVDPEADLAEHIHNYTTAKRCIEELAIFLKPLPQAAAVNASSSSSAITSSTITSTSSSSSSSSSPPIILSRPMQRKLVLLVNCQLMEEEGRTRAVKASRSLGERAATELIVLHQNPQQLSANLWAGVRARGCQFLGPAMQEEVLRLILLALEDGSALSRKVLVLFVVQRLETQYPQASKTAIGHVVQLLYRASCFKVTKREDESSLMQFKDEFRTYDALRREHDSQIVQIATEAGLRISPEQWSSLLYGDTAHKSHMQSIIDKLQTPQSFGQSITELSLALQRTGDLGNLAELTPHLELLANVDPNADNPWESWPHLQQVLESVVAVVRGLIAFTGLRARKPLPQEYAYPPPFNAIPTSSTPISSPTPGQPLTPHSAKYKTSMCRDLTLRGQCPRGNSCTFAHSHDEMSRFRQRSKKLLLMPGAGVVAASSLASIYPSPCHTPETSMCDNMSPQSTAALLHALQMSLSHSMASVSKPKPTMAVSQPQMATKTQISSQPNKPIMSVAVRMAGVEKHNVNVPIARPSTLPGSTKQLLHKESIYTSPTLVETKGGPNIMPIHQKAPQQQGERGPGGPGGPPGQHRLLTGQQNHQEPTAQHSNNHQQEDEAFMRNTMALPPNPYTTRAGAPPSNPTVQVKTSMKQQLGELERRRDELLSKLNRHDRSQPQITCTTASASTSPLPASTLAALSTVIVLTQELMNKQGSSSVADSMATTCTMMSLADSGARNRRSPVVSSSPVTSQYSNSAPSSSVSSSSSSISSSSSVFTSMSSPHLFTTQYSSLTSRGEAVVRSSPSHSVPENWSNTFLEQTDILLLNDQGDEYVPMKHTTVSKYGPISRGGRAKERLNGVAPVNVIAGQIGDMIPVMAVTPNMHHTGNQHEEPTTIWRAGPPLPPQHIAPPRMNMGVTIASSLPTALMKPHVIAAATATENTPGAGLEAPQSLWALKEKMLSNMSDKNPHSHADQTKIHADLCCVSKQIKNLQASEEERMTRELQSIELNIKETQRRVSDREQQDFLLAREEQNYELAVEQEKAVQEAYDMHLAQKLALQEASDAVMRTNNVQQQH